MAITKSLFGTNRSIPQTNDRRWGAQLHGIVSDMVSCVDSSFTLLGVVGIPRFTVTSSELSSSGTLTPVSPLHRVFSDGGAVTLSATTAIADGSVDGQVLILEGTSDTDTVTVPNAANTDLNGSITLTLGDMVSLVWNDTRSLWVERTRNS